jgi:hypothetical protein
LSLPDVSIGGAKLIGAVELFSPFSWLLVLLVLVLALLNGLDPHLGTASSSSLRSSALRGLGRAGAYLPIGFAAAKAASRSLAAVAASILCCARDRRSLPLAVEDELVGAGGGTVGFGCVTEVCEPVDEVGEVPWVFISVDACDE